MAIGWGWVRRQAIIIGLITVCEYNVRMDQLKYIFIYISKIIQRSGIGV